ncbi:14116_t:CDS:2 [Cetraspora pellucida]|uniref:14116_t:CDS:1 n=1 Tax=Cetraspora pellucida TaxID=1433469 RepID=A0A9N8W4X2_9GLOM|nr:14116_t:CDS:2 [Cetraspora pellucida]
MALDLEKILLRDISQLFQDADDYNVQIHVGQEPNIRIFKAHSVILRARSSYFRAALSVNWARTDPNSAMITLKKPNISPIVFEIILKINYSLLLVAADELALIDLIDHIQAHIIRNEQDLLRINLIEFLQVSSRHDACRLLKAHSDLKRWHFAQEAPYRARIAPRIKPFVSSIISPGHIGQLAAWIDNKQEPYLSRNPYEFKLLMLGSRDGLYNVREFQRRCGKKGPTIIVIKIKNSNRIIGGYNPIEWCSSEGYLSSRDSFIFSFDNNKNTTNSILSRVKNPDCAIFNSDSNYIGFGSDLEWFGGICEQYNYQRKILNQIDFTMENYEVFQVKKRYNY